MQPTETTAAAREPDRRRSANRHHPPAARQGTHGCLYAGVQHQASAGGGKTRGSHRKIRKLAAAGKTVRVYCPTHEFAQESCESYNATLDPLERQTTVFYGRGHQLPDGTFMCRKSAFAELMADAQLPIGPSMCIRPATKGKNGAEPKPAIKCPFFDICGYQDWKSKITPGSVVFLCSEYLFYKIEDAAEPDFVFIEEQFYKASLREIKNISVSRLGVPILNKVSYEGKLRLTNEEFENMRLVRQAIANVIATGKLTPPRVQAAGITPEMLADAAVAEGKYADYSGIAPDMPEIDQRNRYSKYKADSNGSEGLKFAQMYRLMATEIRVEHKRFASVHLHRKAKRLAGGGREDRIDLHWSAEAVLPDNVPVLMMDADFDPIIARRFFPRLTQITVVEGKRRNLHVTQLIGNVMPKSRFVDEPELDDEERQRRANRCRELSYLIEVEADRLRVMGDRLSIFMSSYKGVDEWLRKRGRYPGVDTSHYNVNRGRNRWNSVDAPSSPMAAPSPGSSSSS